MITHVSGVKCLNDRDPFVMVDDNDTDLYIAKRFYRMCDLANPFVAIESGTDFLDYMDAVDAGEKPMPAIVLLDLNMPGLDGLSTLELIRNRPVFAEVPVVVIHSNSSDPRDFEKSQNLGANGFVTKSLDLETYVSFFNSLAANE